ncbi:MAG: hypothetical protein WKG07_35855 [Hymenobacter sp.]
MMHAKQHSRPTFPLWKRRPEQRCAERQHPSACCPCCTPPSGLSRPPLDGDPRGRGAGAGGGPHRRRDSGLRR